MPTKPPPSAAAAAATAFWATGPCEAKLRTERLPSPGPGEATVRALFSGVSRGTELLVHRGTVPAAVAHLMRAPFQEGEFPFPVKYGYLSVGVVERGPDQVLGRRVFCLHPHQDRYVVPGTALTVIPDEVPSARAVLTGSVETAINALWECSPRFGDRVAVVGAGAIGGSLAALLRRFPLERLQLVDPDPAKGAIAAALGVEWALPRHAMQDCDIVYHASATEDGLAGGLAQLGDEGDLVELSWYGTHSPRVPLGLDFHARRLRIRGTQVGAVSAARRPRRTHADRLALAVAALTDPSFDALLGETADFANLPSVMESLCQGTLPGMCPVIKYPGAMDPAGLHRTEPSTTQRG